MENQSLPLKTHLLDPVRWIQVVRCRYIELHRDAFYKLVVSLGFLGTYLPSKCFELPCYFLRSPTPTPASGTSAPQSMKFQALSEPVMTFNLT